MNSDARDLVIEMLADAEAELLDRVVDLMIERDAYRMLAQQAIHALHDVTLDRDVLLGQRTIDRRRERVERRKAA